MQYAGIIVGLCEMRWKYFGEMSTGDGHKLYFSGHLGMVKLGRMHRQTGETFVDPTAMWKQMREVSDL